MNLFSVANLNILYPLKFSVSQKEKPNLFGVAFERDYNRMVHCTESFFVRKIPKLKISFSNSLLIFFKLLLLFWSVEIRHRPWASPTFDNPSELQVNNINYSLAYVFNSQKFSISYTENPQLKGIILWRNRAEFPDVHHLVAILKNIY